MSNSLSVDDLAGKTVVLTGAFAELKRAEATAALKDKGAKCTGSVSKNTDILFVGAKAGSKLAKALANGVAVYGEDTLKDLLEKVSSTNLTVDMDLIHRTMQSLQFPVDELDKVWRGVASYGGGGWEIEIIRIDENGDKVTGDDEEHYIARWDDARESYEMV